ncbi:MAG: hypothetical protein M1820_005876 [Bogoriella megaspora]|nr:MAG: hypothetical protein M1820_005876 [Bogoriella megaspora]
MSLTNDLSVLPITAVVYYLRYILLGTGNRLRVVNQDSQKILFETKVFDAQAIHGLVVEEVQGWQGLSHILAWGGSKIRTAAATFELERPTIRLGKEADAPDRILDAIFQQRNEAPPEGARNRESAEAILVTAHNALLRCRWNRPVKVEEGARDSDRPDITLVNLTAGPRCILYSVHIAWLTSTRVLVAAGTVFGEIIVWSCETVVHQGTEIPTTHNVFTGHEGSIFGVCISELLQCDNERAAQRLLATCSDDRTIRIWQIPELEELQTQMTPHEATGKLQARHTGFATQPSNITMNKAELAPQLAWTWAHASRIWSIRFLSNEPLEQDSNIVTRLFSVAEDATCQFWTLERTNSDGGSSFHLRNTHTSEPHVGKNIWASAHATQNVISGGADGRLISHHMPTKYWVGHPIAHEEWSVDDVSRNLEIHDRCAEILSFRSQETGAVYQDVGFAGKDTALEHEPRKGLERERWVQYPLHVEDMFREYAFVRPDSFVTVTKAGTLLLATLQARNPGPLESNKTQQSLVKWIRVMNFENIRSDSVLSKACVTHPFCSAFFGGRDGVIYHYDISGDLTIPVAKMDGKISSLFLDCMKLDPGNLNSSCFYSLTATVGQGQVLHSFLYKTHDCSQDEFESSHSVFKLPPGFTVTTCKHVLTDLCHEVLFAGSRNGSIAIYHLRRRLGTSSPEHRQPPAGQTQSETNHPKAILEAAHGKEAVTALQWIPEINTSDSFNSGFLFSTGRDGTFAVYRLKILLDTIASSLVHKTSLLFGPYVEGFHIEQNSQHLLLWGFRNKRFVLWDETAEEEFMNVDCGGAHRNWAFYLSDDCLGGTFVWTKAGVCNVYRQTKPLHERVLNGGHGREIKAVAVAPQSKDSKANGPLVATGAEDTDIRIFQYDLRLPEAQGEQRMRCLRVLRRHNTGIQCLKWSSNGKYLFSSGGFEELFVWRVRRAPILGLAVLCESVLPFKSEEGDLRIMNFDLREHRNDESTIGSVNPENLDIACAYSDSTVHVYRYDSTNGTNPWQYLYLGAYGPNHACLTQTMLLPNFSTLLTVGGDGQVALWNAASVFSSPSLKNPSNQNPIPGTLQSRHRVHQSSVKSLAYYHLDDHTTLLLTGGDDNALGISLLRLNNEQEAEPPKDHIAQSSSVSYPISTILIPRAHAAAITAVALIRPPTHRRPSDYHQDFAQAEEILWAVTSSNDQRIKLWEIRTDVSKSGVEGIAVKKLANRPTGVADLADIAAMQGFNMGTRHGDADASGRGESDADDHVKVVVCGVGMEVWTIAA